MPLQVLPAVVADFPVSLAVQGRAHADNPIVPVVFPGPFSADPSEKIDAMARECEEYPSITWLKVVDTDLETKGEEGRIAFAKWVIWEGEPQRLPTNYGPEANLEACAAFFRPIQDKNWERFKGKGHACKSPPYLINTAVPRTIKGNFVYITVELPLANADPESIILDLHLLHTEPAQQRRGAGGMLVKWGTQEADRLGLVSYLEATPVGRPLYKKYGFRELETVTVDMSRFGGPVDSSIFIMVRDPVREM